METQPEFPSTDEILLRRGLYSKIPFRFDDTPHLVKLKFFTGVIDAYCPDCQSKSILRAKSKFRKDFVFLVNTPYPSITVESIVSRALRLSTDEKDLFHQLKRLAEEGSNSLQGIDQNAADYLFQECVEFLGDESEFFNLDFECTRSKDHAVRFVFRVRDLTLEKIGQHPSFADLTSKGNSTFTRVLDPPKQKEYKRAVGLYSHGIGIGAFVYLRRILENLIEEAHAKAKETEGWDKPEYENAQGYSDRIKLLKGHLPTFMVENAPLYSILSKGIHELGEKECHDLFPVMRQGIDLILIEEHRRLEEEKVREDTNRDLNRLHSEYGQPD